MVDRATKRRVTQAHLDAIEQESGPIYGVRLLDSLPLDGGMRQALPSRNDLKRVREISERTVAGFEVLTEHYRRAKQYGDEQRRRADRLEQEWAADREQRAKAYRRLKHMMAEGITEQDIADTRPDSP